MTTAALRFGMVGAGSVAQVYAQAFDGCARARLAAVADCRGALAAALAEAAGCRSFASHEAMHDAAALDAVLVCTPPATHPELALYFLERGIPVLCEKPLSIDVASARRMIDAAARAGVPFTMASKFRYVDDLVRAKHLVLSGVLGDLVLCENTFASRLDMSARWNADPAVSGGGVLIDNGAHSADIIRYVLGPVTEVLAVEGRRTQGLVVEESVHLLARCDGGQLAVADLSWSLHKGIDSYFTVHGTRGTLSVGWHESKYRLASSPEWIVFGGGYDKVRAFRAQIENFVAAIADGAPLAVTPADALASVEVIAAAYAALASERWTAVGGAAPRGARVSRLEGRRS